MKINVQLLDQLTAASRRVMADLAPVAGEDYEQEEEVTRALRTAIQVTRAVENLLASLHVKAAPIGSIGNGLPANPVQAPLRSSPMPPLAQPDVMPSNPVRSGGND